MILTKRQEGLLRDLLNDDVWVSLLDQIEADSEVRPWKPGGKAAEDEKQSKWVYDSGIKRGKSDLLTIFRMNTQKGKPDE